MAVRITRTTYRYEYPDGSVSSKTKLCCPEEGCVEEFDEFQGLASHAQQVHGLHFEESSSSNAVPKPSEASATQKLGSESEKHPDACDIQAAIAAANAEYDQKKVIVQNLARSGADREVLAKEHEHLKQLKRRHAELVKAGRSQAPSTHQRGWHAYPCWLEIPRDANFVISFGVDDVDAARAWMEKYGFVVFQNVISDDDCANTRKEIWKYLESKVSGFCKDDPETWKKLSATETGRYYDAYGLPPDPVIFTKQLLRNRQNGNVVKALKAILGPEEILVSHDRWCLYRPTEVGGGKPTRNNLHLDLHPWRYLDGKTRIEELRYEDGHDHEFSLEIPRSRAEDGPHIQGVLNLLDNLEEDGGTQLVPGFHHIFSKWKSELGDETDWLFKAGQSSNWLHPGNGGASFKIPLKQGSLLLWDQRCVHGSRPNSSSKVRMAQFLRAFRRAPLSKDRAVARARAVLRKVEAAGLLGEVSEIGMEVFGFHDLHDFQDFLAPAGLHEKQFTGHMSRETYKSYAGVASRRRRCLASLAILWVSRRSIQTIHPTSAGVNFEPCSSSPLFLRKDLQIPRLGFGTGRPGGSRDSEVTLEEGRKRLITAVQTAMVHGYRLIDTTLFSGMEGAIIEGIRASGVEQSEVTIATKLLQMAHKDSRAVQESLETSLSNLNCSCIDLYLLQSPRGGNIKEVWSKLIELRNQGLISALGVSNFGAAQLEGMRLEGLELPEVNQVEIHCWRQLPTLAEYHRRHGIATMCMAPLARGEMFGKTEVATIARELGKSEAAVAVRWCLQMGYIPIPRTVQVDRIQENMASTFELTNSHMERIKQVDGNYVACRKASPCCELPWDAIADSIPDKSLWDESKRRKVEAAERRSKLQEERIRKAIERQERQMLVQAEDHFPPEEAQFLEHLAAKHGRALAAPGRRFGGESEQLDMLHRGSTDGHYPRLPEALQQLQVVSLGSFCGMKFSIQRLGLGDAHLPFDWIRTTSKGLRGFLRNGFEKFFEAKRYDLAEAGMTVHRAEQHSFWHDDVSKPEVRQKLQRRVHRFLNLANNESRDLLFIRSCACTDELLEVEACQFAVAQASGRLLLAMEQLEGPILHAFLPGLAFFLQPLASQEEGNDGKAFSWALEAACDAALASEDVEGFASKGKERLVQSGAQLLVGDHLYKPDTGLWQ
eukprot:symbB.v1.2.008647.t2/scaffold540.1/size189765/12